MNKPNYNLFQSFYFAISGIAHAVKSERNLRIHFSVAAYVLYFSRYYEFERGDLALLLLSIGLVITCELFNTAIENTVDLKTPVYNPLAKTAKDVAAGAVLVSSLASVVVGVLLLWEPAVLLRIFADILKYPVIWIVLVIMTIVWIAWPNPKTGRRYLGEKDERE